MSRKIWIASWIRQDISIWNALNFFQLHESIFLQYLIFKNAENTLFFVIQTDILLFLFQYFNLIISNKWHWATGFLYLSRRISMVNPYKHICLPICNPKYPMSFSQHCAQVCELKLFYDRAKIMCIKICGLLCCEIGDTSFEFLYTLKIYKTVYSIYSKIWYSC